MATGRFAHHTLTHSLVGMDCSRSAGMVAASAAYALASSILFPSPNGGTSMHGAVPHQMASPVDGDWWRSVFSHAPSLSSLIGAVVVLAIRFAIGVAIEVLVACDREKQAYAARRTHQRRSTANAARDVRGVVVRDASRLEQVSGADSPGFDVARAALTNEIALPALALSATHYCVLYVGLTRPLVHWVGLESLAAAIISHLLVYECVPAAAEQRLDATELKRIAYRALTCGVAGRLLLHIDSSAWPAMVASMSVIESLLQLRSVTIRAHNLPWT